MATIATFTISFRDAKNKTGKMQYYLNLDDYGAFNGDTLLDAHDYLQEVVKRVNEITKGVIVRCSLCIDIDLPSGLRTTAEPDSDVEEGARFIFPVTAYDTFFKSVIPTFDHARFPEGRKTIDPVTGDTDVRSLILMLIQPDIAPDWSPDYGGISDNRGVPLPDSALPVITKVFKPR